MLYYWRISSWTDGSSRADRDIGDRGGGAAGAQCGAAVGRERRLFRWWWLRILRLVLTLAVYQLTIQVGMLTSTYHYKFCHRIGLGRVRCQSCFRVFRSQSRASPERQWSPNSLMFLSRPRPCRMSSNLETKTKASMITSLIGAIFDDLESFSLIFSLDELDKNSSTDRPSSVYVYSLLLLTSRVIFGGFVTILSESRFLNGFGK